MEGLRQRLQPFYQEVSAIILSRQNAATGLIPASVAITTHGDYRDAWVRDNVYSILAVWGLALAYRRMDDEEGRAFELEHATIKCMRGLLFCMMRQVDKVERFKATQSLEHALHAKYNTATGATVVGDWEWGHLQIDATSLFLLMLAQMTASGLHLIYTLDEVAFVQNLTFYIERAYRTQDYGIWERGNKLNHGLPELNSSSIGMVVAALQAINGINLFGSRGGPASVIHVLADEITRNYTTLQSALPRESASKEIDAALLSIISFPAFAVADERLVTRTRNEIIKKLGGAYGCKRFLRDGHQTVLEDTSRLHYDARELQEFAHIECEWPLFFTYLILDGQFRGDAAMVAEYQAKLEHTAIRTTLPSAPRVQAPPGATSTLSPGLLAHSGNVATAPEPAPPVFKLIPELYKVPRAAVEAEKRVPGSQVREPNENVPLVWAQSLYILGNLISNGLLQPADIDPLGRRFLPANPATTDVVVQVVLLAESRELQQRLLTYGIETQTMESCAPITIAPPAALKEAYSTLGENTKLGLSGRPKRPVGTLSTCKLYRFQGRLYAFLPHFMDKEEFYLVSDNDYLVSLFEQELQFVKTHWFGCGRPTMIIMFTQEMFRGPGPLLGGGEKAPAPPTAPQEVVNSSPNSAGASSREADRRTAHWRGHSKRNLLNFIMSLKTGIFGGVRIRLGRLSDMVNTSCIESLDFLLASQHHGSRDWHALFADSACHCNFTLTQRMASANSQSRAVRRSPSIIGDVVKSLLASPVFYDRCEAPSAELEGNRFKLREPVEDEPSRLGHSGRADEGAGPGLALPSLTRRTFASEVLNHRSLIIASGGGGGSVSPDPAVREGQGDEKGPSILTLTLGEPSQLAEAQALLATCANLYDQVDLVHYILSCTSMDFVVPGLGTIAALLEEVYGKAMHLKQWTVVRHSAGLLKKIVNNLTINVAELLIRQKPVTVGYGGQEYSLASPMNPTALSTIINTHCVSDVREAPLVQEIITYLGSLIRSNPHLFDGIMRIRTYFFIIAVREEISRMKGINEEEAVEQMMHLSPFELKSLLSQVLTDHEQQHSPSTGESGAEGRWRPMSDGSPIGAATLAGLPRYASSVLTISVQAAGFADGNFARVHVDRDGMSLLVALRVGRGLNVVVVDPFDGSIVSTAIFDTHVSVEDAEELTKLIEWIEPGVIVVVAGKDDCCENLTDAARTALATLGSACIRKVRYRDSWCLIGEKGAAPGTVPEAHVACGNGATHLLTREYDIAQRRERLLAQATAGADRLPLAAPNLSLNLLLPSSGRWLRKRKNNGALNRVPEDFYVKVWALLSKVHGIRVGGEVLPRDPTISEKTPEEFNFALQVESLLDNIRDPAERQIAVECLVVIHKIGVRNPEIRLKSGILDLQDILRDAIQTFWAVWVAEQRPGPDAATSASGHGADEGGGDGGALGGESANVRLVHAMSMALATTKFGRSRVSSASALSSAMDRDTVLLRQQGDGSGGLLVHTTAALDAGDTSSRLVDLSFERHERFARLLFFDLPQGGSLRSRVRSPRGPVGGLFPISKLPELISEALIPPNYLYTEGKDGSMAFLARSCVRMVFEVNWNDAS